VLAALESGLVHGLALGALELEGNLLGGLGLLVENGLGLTTITRLLAIVTALTLSIERRLTSLVLSDLVSLVLVALAAVSPDRLGVVDLRDSAMKWKNPAVSYVLRKIMIFIFDRIDKIVDGSSCSEWREPNKSH
jgi:hypothetical protein